jgi:hypothetical protein
MAVKGGYATRVGKSSLLPLCIPEVATRIFAHPVLHILITYLMGYEYMQDEAMYAKKVAYRHALKGHPAGHRSWIYPKSRKDAQDTLKIFAFRFESLLAC